MNKMWATKTFANLCIQLRTVYYQIEESNVSCVDNQSVLFQSQE